MSEAPLVFISPFTTLQWIWKGGVKQTSCSSIRLSNYSRKGDGMVVEELKIGNVQVCIHDDYIVSENKVQDILERISYLAYKQMKEGDVNRRGD